jgi:signal transduction histidine kinase
VNFDTTGANVDDTTLLRNAHHGIRSPIGSIYNVTEMMLLGLDGPLTANLRESVTCIVDDARRLHRVGEALLDYLRAVERPLNPQPVNVARVLRDAVATAQERAAGTDKTILCPAKPRLLQLTIDHVALYDLLGYMLRYMVLFGAESVIPVTVSATRRQVRMYAGDADLTEADAAPFPERLTKDEAGIMLLICRRLAARLGGVFHVQQSREGRLGLSLSFPRP